MKKGPFKMSGMDFGTVDTESPIKGKGDNLKRIMTANKVAQKKAGTWYAPGANPNKSSMPKDFNIKGSNTSTTPRYNPNTPKNFNIQGSKSSTTPGYSSTKTVKSYPGQELNEALKKAVNKNLNPKPKKIVHKGVVNIAKNVGRKVAKFAAKRLGPVGAAITAYDVVKTIPKVTKATVKGLKEKAKSGNVNLGRKL